MELVLLEFVVDAARSDADESSGLGLITTCGLEHALKENFLAVFQRPGQVPAILIKNVAKVRIRITSGLWIGDRRRFVRGNKTRRDFMQLSGREISQSQW